MVHPVHISLVLLGIADNALCVYTKSGRLPSAPFAYGTSLDETLAVLCKEAVGGRFTPYVEQLYTTPDPIEKGSIVVVYMGLVSMDDVPPEVSRGMRRVGAEEKSFRESDILSYAVQRLRWKIEYTNVVYSLLPEQFTLSRLQSAYEAILGKTLDKRNFRKKILSLGLLKDTGKKKALGRARPAEIYSFKDRKLTIMEIL